MGDVYDAPPGLYFEPGAPKLWVGIDNDDGVPVLWPVDADFHRVEPTIKQDGNAWNFTFGSGRRVVFMFDGQVTVFDGSTGSVIGTIDVLGTAYTTAADDLFITNNGGDLTRYDLDTLRPIRTFGGSRGFIHELWGTEDGTFIATSSDQFVTLFDVASGESLGEPIVIPTGDDIRSISIARRASVALGRRRHRDRRPAVGSRPRTLGDRGVSHGRPKPHRTRVGQLHRRSRPHITRPAPTGELGRRSTTSTAATGIGGTAARLVGCC